MPILRVASTLDESASARVTPDGRFVLFWAFWGAKLPKIWDSLPRTPINHSANFDAASFIFGREILNHTKLHTQKLHTNSKRYNYPHLAYRHVWIKRITCRNCNTQQASDVMSPLHRSRDLLRSLSATIFGWLLFCRRRRIKPTSAPWLRGHCLVMHGIAKFPTIIVTWITAIPVYRDGSWHRNIYPTLHE